MTSRSDKMKSLHTSLREQGFDVVLARSGHFRVIAPDGRKICIPATPSRETSVYNAITRLKRIGYVPPRRK